MKRVFILLLLQFLPVCLFAQVEEITKITEEFNGKLYVYENKDEALSGLKARLTEKIEKRLKQMGFSQDYIITLLKKAKYHNIEVIEKRVEILKDNKRVKTTAFDLSGAISISIDKQDIKELGEILKRVSPISDEEKAFYKEALRNFIDLSKGIKDFDVSNLQFKLSEIYKGDILKQMRTTFGTDNTSFPALQERVVDILNAIDTNKAYLKSEDNITELAESLISNVEFYLKRSVIDISNHNDAVSCVKNISKMMPVKKEESLKSFMFIIEFKWAENIQNISQSSNVEIARLYSEIEGFVTNYPNSKFLKNIKAKATTRLIEEMKDEDLEYDSFQYILLVFDRLNLKDLRGEVIKKCQSVMEGVESPSDDVSEKINESFKICLKYVDPSARKKISILKDRFVKTDKTRIYRNLLGNLAFLMRVVRYADSIPFGASPDKVNSGRFADFLSEGTPGSGCTCTSGEKDDCRIYVYAGDQFEVVIRYNNEKLYEVSICNMNIKGKASVILSYLKENFRALFKFDISSIEEKDGSFDYEVKKGVVLTFEKVGFYGNVSISDKRFRPKVQEKIYYSAPQEGDTLKKGDCVEWDCEIECRYKGKIEKISASELQVIITSAPKAADLNMRKNIKRSTARRCQSF